MSEWISVKDRLPTRGVDILGYAGLVYWGWYCEFGFLDNLEECIREETTHWMPLPNPPEVAE